MIPVTFLFWNAGGRTPTAEIAYLARRHSVDVVVLAEFDGAAELLDRLNSEGRARYHVPRNASTRLVFFVAAPPECLVTLHDGPGVAVRHFRPPIGEEVLLIALHLGSKRHLKDGDQADLAPRTARLIEQFEAQIGHRRTMVIGDLNMDPFEPGVYGSEGFHATMSRAIASKGERTVSGDQRRFFYNPMWSLLGDGSAGPPGTYYRWSSTPRTLFWHTLDQVLLRPALAERFEPGDVAVLDAAGDRRLLTPAGVPDKRVSDHLPIRAVVRVEEFSDGTEEPVG